MSGFTSLTHKWLGTMNARERPVDPLSRLRYTFETLPGSHQHVWSTAARGKVLAELYDAFWGAHANLFLPASNPTLPAHTTLAEYQARTKFNGAGEDDPTIPGRPCGHIFNKGESCFRCKCVSINIVSWLFVHVFRTRLF